MISSTVGGSGGEKAPVTWHTALVKARQGSPGTGGARLDPAAYGLADVITGPQRAWLMLATKPCCTPLASRYRPQPTLPSQPMFSGTGSLTRSRAGLRVVRPGEVAPAPGASKRKNLPWLRTNPL